MNENNVEFEVEFEPNIIVNERTKYCNKYKFYNDIWKLLYSYNPCNDNEQFVFNDEISKIETLYQDLQSLVENYKNNEYIYNKEISNLLSGMGLQDIRENCQEIEAFIKDIFYKKTKIIIDRLQKERNDKKIEYDNLDQVGKMKVVNNDRGQLTYDYYIEDEIERIKQCVSEYFTLENKQNQCPEACINFLDNNALPSNAKTDKNVNHQDNDKSENFFQKISNFFKNINFNCNCSCKDIDDEKDIEIARK